jgi:hypothetical protein
MQDKGGRDGSLVPSPLAAGALLALLMLVTRFREVGVMVHLGDASLAVFFVGGLLLRRHLAFCGFLALAVLVDLVALGRAGAADSCFTVAYAFLAPTYASLWYAGAWCADREPVTRRGLFAITGAAVLGVASAFLISSGSFYLFSGLFADPGWSVFAARVARWFPGYAWGMLAWSAVLMAAVQAARSASARAIRS